MTQFFAAARDEIERFGGTVEKFIGDAVMAIFGLPAVHEDDPERAALAVPERLRRLVDAGLLRLDHETRRARALSPRADGREPAAGLRFL